MTIDDLTIGMEINNDTLCEIFGCSSQGGNASLKTYKYARAGFESRGINL